MDFAPFKKAPLRRGFFILRSKPAARFGGGKAVGKLPNPRLFFLCSRVT